MVHFRSHNLTRQRFGLSDFEECLRLRIQCIFLYLLRLVEICSLKSVILLIFVEIGLKLSCSLCQLDCLILRCEYCSIEGGSKVICITLKPLDKKFWV